MLIVPVVVAAILLVVGVGAAGLLAGDRAGDQLDDARVEVALRGGQAVVSVANPHPGTIVVSCATAVLGVGGRVVAAPGRHTAWRRGLLGRRDTLLGAVEGYGSETWLLLLPGEAGSQAARLRVRVEQSGGRTRVHTHRLAGHRALSEAR